MSRIKPKNQQEVDAKAIKESNAVGSDNPGGQNKISAPRKDQHGDGGPSIDSQKPRFKGVRIHDSGLDSWKMKSTPRYERD